MRASDVAYDSTVHTVFDTSRGLYSHEELDSERKGALRVLQEAERKGEIHHLSPEPPTERSRALKGAAHRRHRAMIVPEDNLKK